MKKLSIEKEMSEIKNILANYFAKRLVNKVDDSIVKKGIIEKDLESWLKES